jgi:O-methyltransferase
MKLKNAVLIPDLILGAAGVIPAPVIHNLAKSISLKMAFWHLAVDQVEGAYFEFGVASGNSMRSAEIAERTAHSSSLGVAQVRRELVGFDTFESFSSQSAADTHSTWQGENFSVPIHKVKKRFRRVRDRVSFHAIDCSRLGSPLDDYGPIEKYVQSEKVALLLFDMDLGDPTEKALEWIRPKLQNGSVIIFDEYFAFRGDPAMGEARAWSLFLEKNPRVSARMMKTYGDGGAVFQINLV